MIPSFCQQSITRLRAGVKNSRGTEVPDWDKPDTLVITDVSVQPASSNISMDGRVLGISDGYTVYCNPDTDVKADDRILFEGNTFLVSEEPRNWVSPTGRVSSMQFTMVRYDG